MKDKNQIDDPKIGALLEYANSIIATLREPFLVLDKKLQIISANRAFYITFKVAEKETIGRPLPELGDGQWNIPGLLKLLKEIIPEKKVVEDYEVEHKFEHIGERVICLNARQLRVSREMAAIVAAGDREEELILLAIEDITERKRLQVELKDSEERYRRAFETSRDGLLLVHKTGGDILNSNESARELLGYSHDEFLKKKLWGVGITKDAKDFQEMASILERDGVIHYEDTPVKTKKNLSINSEVFLVDRAKVIQCNIRDITEHKKAAALVRGLLNEQRTILNSVPAIVFYKDKENRFIRTNKAFEDAMGLSKEHLEGKSCFDIYPKEQAEAYWKDDKEVMTSGEPKRNIREAMLSDKGMFLMQTDKMPYKDPQGNVIGVINFALDITERQRAEEAIAESEANYRAIFESSNDAIIIMNVKTYGIVDANKIACRMFRYPKEEIKETDFGSLCADSAVYTIEKLKSFYDKASNGDSQLFEWLAKDKLGREFWIEINVKRAIIAGQYRLLSIARDVTERKQLLEQKDSFLNMVSHELRTPLGAIKESVSLLSEGKVGSIDEKEKEMIDIAKRNVDRLSRLINDVLDLQKIDAGMMKFSVNENDMNEAIKEVHSAMFSLASKKGLNFVLNLDDKLSHVKFDKDKILQVLINLVNNAIKFTEKGDITIVSMQGDNFVRVSVKDTGPGIKTEDLSKLFQRFSQLKRIPGGTGLGLAISKEIIDMHRGKVKAESEFGKGTTVSFVLPIEERRV